MAAKHRSGGEIASKLLICLGILGFLLPQGSFAVNQPELANLPLVEVLELKGQLDLSDADLLELAINKAQDDQAELLIIHMETWGGSYRITERGIEAISLSSVPIVCWLSSVNTQVIGGGTWWLLASPWVAMAPGTSFQLAVPDNIIDGYKLSSEQKQSLQNRLKGLVLHRGMAALDLVDGAIQKKNAITADDAIRSGLIDAVVPDQESLLRFLNGKETVLANGDRVTLNLKDVTIKNVGVSNMNSIVEIITDPNIAYLFLLSGLLLLLYEIFHPGGIIPGVLGFIFTAAGLIGLGTLPLNLGGLFLIVLAMVLFFLEIKITSWGILAVGGLVSMIFGSLILIDRSGGEYPGISLVLIIGASLMMLAFFLFVLSKGLRIQLRKPVTGMEGMVGLEGRTTTIVDSNGGRGMVRGEYWDMMAESGAIAGGETIVVVGHDHFRLTVKPKPE